MGGHLLQELGLIPPKEMLNIFDMLAPVSQFSIPGCTVKHYDRFSLVELTDLASKNYVLTFLLDLLPYPNEEIGTLDGLPYSAVILDGVEYTAVTLEYAKAALNACDIKLV